MSRRSGKSWVWVLLALVAVGFNVWRDIQDGPEISAKQASKVFEVILGAKLHDHRDNDGDSFHLNHNGQTHEFRLYFADCPEKKRHQFNGDRLAEQGQYFGGLSEAETVAIGRQAQTFTLRLLSTQSFTLYTKWQSVYNSRRHYAFIVFADGEDLSAKLIRAGLARIHTSGIALPDGRSVTDYQNQLRDIEQQARSQRMGAWAKQP
jgi:endonuclease YncB( thermonuclease family)